MILNSKGAQQLRAVAVLFEGMVWKASGHISHRKGHAQSCFNIAFHKTWLCGVDLTCSLAPAFGPLLERDLGLFYYKRNIRSYVIFRRRCLIFLVQGLLVRTRYSHYTDQSLQEQIKCIFCLCLVLDQQMQLDNTLSRYVIIVLSTF